MNSTQIGFRLGAAIFVTATLASSNAAACLLSDVSLTINSAVYSPIACSDGLAQGGGSAAETNTLAAALGALGFIYLDKSDDLTTPVGIGGATFVVGADTGNSGSWTMSWAEQPGSPKLPLTKDLAIGLFGGGSGSGYLFEDVVFTSNPTNGSGSYDINFLNSAGREPNLGHRVLAATFALLGLCLVGLGFSRGE